MTNRRPMISQDILDYLNGLVVSCPYCHIELRLNNIPEDQLSIYRNDAYLKVFCARCHNRWMEVMELGHTLGIKREK